MSSAATAVSGSGSVLSVPQSAPAGSAASADSPGAPALRMLPERSRMEPTGTGRQPDLAVLPALAPLFPSGSLRRGVTMTVTAAATGSTSLALALLAGPSAEGAWCALVGVPSIGVRAAAEMGVVLERFALVPCSGTAVGSSVGSAGGSSPGPAAGPAGSGWSTAVAALLDGMDIVAVRPPRPVRGGEARRLAARARERGTVLLCLDDWEGADLRLSVSSRSPVQWNGLGSGTGRLRARRIRACASGRGAFARPRETELWLPAPGGGVRAVDAADPIAGTTDPAAERPRIEAVS